MFRRGLSIPFLALLLFCGLACSCAVSPPNWRSQSSLVVEELGSMDARSLFPQEYNNVLETYEHGEAIFHVQKDSHQSDVYYLFALQKGAILKNSILLVKRRQAEELRLRAAAEAARVREEQLLQQAAEAEERLKVQENRKTEQESVQTSGNASVSTVKETSTPKVLSYTVRRGETLPQIAARTEVYNDSSLWSLIYRSNRDQIRDPRQLWPGQVLKIPRNVSRSDLLDAKRYIGKK